MTKGPTAKFLILLLLGGNGGGVASASSAAAAAAADDPSPTRTIRTIMCETESCENADATTPGCRAYDTPLDACYNARTLFPGDDSWSDLDIYDTTIMRNLKRTFYESKDGSCAGRGEDDGGIPQPVDGDDEFILPFDACVGPFGPPRPWGKFTLLDGDFEEEGEVLSEE